MQLHALICMHAHQHAHACVHAHTSLGCLFLYFFFNSIWIKLQQQISWTHAYSHQSCTDFIPCRTALLFYTFYTLRLNKMGFSFILYILYFTFEQDGFNAATLTPGTASHTERRPGWGNHHCTQTGMQQQWQHTHTHQKEGGTSTPSPHTKGHQPHKRLDGKCSALSLMIGAPTERQQPHARLDGTCSALCSMTGTPAKQCCWPCLLEWVNCETCSSFLLRLSVQFVLKMAVWNSGGTRHVFEMLCTHWYFFPSAKRLRCVHNALVSASEWYGHCRLVNQHKFLTGIWDTQTGTKDTERSNLWRKEWHHAVSSFAITYIYIDVLVIISKKLNTSVSPLRTQPDNGASWTAGQNDIVRHIVFQVLRKNTGYDVGQIHFADSTATWKAKKFGRRKIRKIMYIKTLGCILF